MKQILFSSMIHKLMTPINSIKSLLSRIVEMSENQNIDSLHDYHMVLSESINSLEFLVQSIGVILFFYF